MSTPLPNPSPGCVVVASLAQARRHKRRFGAMITLQDPRVARRDKMNISRYGTPAPAWLVLEFEDVDTAETGLRVASREQVARAMEFARTYADQSLLVHCHHGVGRSAGIALAVLAERLGAGNEAEAMAQLVAARPEATPNLVVVAHADSLLNRLGRLVAAVHNSEVEREWPVQKRLARTKFVETNRHLYAQAE